MAEAAGAVAMAAANAHRGGDTAQERPTTPSDALRGFLVAFQSDPKGIFWALRGGRVTVGREGTGEPLDVQLSDPTISSRHAAIHVDSMAGTVTVEDTGSTNGTYVNDEHLGYNGKRELKDGDRLRFGGYTTVVKLIAPV